MVLLGVRSPIKRLKTYCYDNKFKKYGYSKGVGLDDPRGHPWDRHLYDRIFAEQAGRGERD